MTNPVPSAMMERKLEGAEKFISSDYDVENNRPTTTDSDSGKRGIGTRSNAAGQGQQTALSWSTEVEDTLMSNGTRRLQ